LASCPATEPTAPDAAEITAVSPALGWPISVIPEYAVVPGMPSTPRYAESGAASRGNLVRLCAAVSEWVCQPREPSTTSPGAKSGDRDATTSPMVSPVITSPICTGAAYDFRSDRRPRMYGSIDSQSVRVTTSPGCGSGTRSSTTSKSSGRGLPDGRRLSTTERRIASVMTISCQAAAARSTTRPLTLPSRSRISASFASDCGTVLTGSACSVPSCASCTSSRSSFGSPT